MVENEESASAADRQAHQAAVEAGLEVVDLHTPGEIRAVSRLLDEIRGRDTGTDEELLLTPEALVDLGDTGGQITGARRDGELIGATVAVLGRGDHGTSHLSSVLTDVLPAAAGRGAGRALKLHQRAWALQRGITTVRWGLDPLVRRTAVFHLVALGARAVDYRRDVGGPADEVIGSDGPTDRLEVEWELTAPRTEQALAGRAAAPDVAAMRRAGAVVVLDVGVGERPTITPSSAPRRLIRIPADIEELTTHDAALARAWRQAVREQLGEALGSGFRIGGMTRDGWYVLAAPAGVEELRAR